MNNLSSVMTPIPANDVEADPVERSHALARGYDAQTLTPLQMDEREIIHFGSARPQLDAFRDLRTRLLATADGNFITLVAPVSSGCGGSFVARNLAVVFTLDRTKSALLVDCNLRNPSQHGCMHVDPQDGGLVDYLEDPDLDVDSVLYDTGMPRLRLLPAGNPRHGGQEAEYFSMFRMRLLVDSLRTSHPERYVFLDSPPVNGAPDARILADLADVVILVAAYGHDTPAAISQAAANFDPAKFAGVVFNERG